jgi:hypothetical protein
MKMHRLGSIVLSLSFALSASGCFVTRTPMVQEQLRTVSAGYTGCMPDDNTLSNVAASLNGSITWNASCKGKAYLCSGVSSGNSAGQSESYHCAPVAQ